MKLAIVLPAYKSRRLLSAIAAAQLRSAMQRRAECGVKVALTMTHATRPEYSEQALACLASALRATPDVVSAAYLAVEPGCLPVMDLCMAWQLAVEHDRGIPVTVQLRSERYGVNRNTATVIDQAFTDGADAVLHCEDDCPVSVDALSYFGWAAERFRDDSSIGTVTGYNRLPEMPPEAAWHDVATRAWFHPWTFLTWNDRWPALRAAIPERAAYTWDGYVLHEMQRRGWREAYPELSRCDNIGLCSSVHPDLYPPSFYAEHHKLKVHAGMVDVPPGDWRVQDEHV